MCLVVKVDSEKNVADVKGKRTIFQPQTTYVRVPIFINYFRFDADRRVWECLSPSLYIRYAQSSIVELNGVIYFHQFQKDNLLRYNTIKDRWSETSVTSVDAKNDQLTYISTIFKSKGFLYAVANGNLHKYDTGLNTWTKVKYLKAKSFQ